MYTNKGRNAFQHSHCSPQTMEGEDQALFHAYPCAYYVQSPSTLSRANSADCQNNLSSCQSPLRHENFISNPTTNSQEVSRFTYLSRYSSSSRGSNNSFLQEKKVVFDVQSHGTGTDNGRMMSGGMEVDGVGKGGGGGGNEDDDEEEEYYYGGSSSSMFSSKGGGGWWRYFSFRTSSSCLWICLQISWRLMVSLGAALLVFYIATKPPPPKVFVKMAGIGQFGLGEGVDSSGVTTKILSCNCSISLAIDNKSKLFGLHIHPPLMELSFSHLPFASSRGFQELYAPSRDSTTFHLSVGTKNKPMYGAGRSMEDMLEAGHGLPLAIRVRLKSRFRVVWSLVEPKFRHQADCLIVLNRGYDKKHKTQSYNSTCVITSF